MIFGTLLWFNLVIKIFTNEDMKQIKILTYSFEFIIQCLKPKILNKKFKV